MSGRISRRKFLTVSGLASASLVLDWCRIEELAAGLVPRKEYPAVVIGAGLGGLCCAALLAGQGIPVTVVEKQPRPGGYAASFSRGAGTFRFDVSLVSTAVNNNAASRILRRLGILDRLKLVELPEFCRLITPDLDITVPQKDPEGFAHTLSEYFPSEKEGIQGFVRELTGVAEEVDRLDRRKGKFIKPLFPIQYPRLWNIRKKTLADLLDDHVHAPDARDVLSALWGYFGLPPSRLSGFYYANAVGEYLTKGAYYIGNRSQDMSSFLAERIRSSGGELLYGREVGAIEVRRKQVTGIVLSDGTGLPARAVIANGSIPSCLDQLPSSVLPDEYRTRMLGYRPSISCFLVWLGLNREIRHKVKGSAILVSPGYGPDREYDLCLKGDVERGPYSVTVYDNMFHGYSMPGTSTLRILFLTGYEPWRQFEADYRQGRKQRYQREKDRWTRILIRRTEERLFPGLENMIQVQEASTPLTNWDYTGNAQGAIYGFEQSMDNSFMNRIRNRTPCTGLYLTGAWAFPGAGFGGVLRSGERTFQEILEDWGKS